MIHIICVHREEHTCSFQARASHAFVRARVCACVCIHTRSCIRTSRRVHSGANVGAILELDHVRNGWWARLGSRWTSQFYGTMVLRAHLAHPPPSNIPRFVESWARKGYANSLRDPLTDVILWSRAPIGFTDDEPGVTLGAFLHG